MPDLAHRCHHPGTIFRLSLRSPQAAQCSEISQESFTADHFMQTLQEFIEVAPALLLFTRHVKAVSVYIKQTSDGPCKLLHESTFRMSNLSSSAGCQLQQVTVHKQSAHNPVTTKVWVKSAHSATDRSQGNVAVLLQDSSVSTGNTLPEVVGKVYSVMALPLQSTNLLVHINGAFCMSSDRRTLWTGEGDRGQVLALLC